MKDFGGLKQVLHSDTLIGARTAVPGKISTASSITPDNTKTETAEGGSIYGGGRAAAEIMFLDHSGHATVKGFMLADTEKFWHFVYKDGHEISTQEAINPFTRLGGGVNARDGVVAWIMDFEQFSHQPVVDRTAAV